MLQDKAELTYDNKDLRERQVAYCIPIPGESAWVTKQFGGKAMTCMSPDIRGPGVGEMGNGGLLDT
jgi:hypothetical protein